MYPLEFFFTWKGLKPCSLQAVMSLGIMEGSVMLLPITSMAQVSGGQSDFVLATVFMLVSVFHYS